MCYKNTLDKHKKRCLTIQHTHEIAEKRTNPQTYPQGYPQIQWITFNDSLTENRRNFKIIYINFEKVIHRNLTSSPI